MSKKSEVWDRHEKNDCNCLICKKGKSIDPNDPNHKTIDDYFWICFDTRGDCFIRWNRVRRSLEVFFPKVTNYLLGDSYYHTLRYKSAGWSWDEEELK